VEIAYSQIAEIARDRRNRAESERTKDRRRSPSSRVIGNPRTNKFPRRRRVKTKALGSSDDVRFRRFRAIMSIPLFFPFSSPIIPHYNERHETHRSTHLGSRRISTTYRRGRILRGARVPHGEMNG